MSGIGEYATAGNGVMGALGAQWAMPRIDNDGPNQKAFIAPLSANLINELGFYGKRRMQAVGDSENIVLRIRDLLVPHIAHLRAIDDLDCMFEAYSFSNLDGIINTVDFDLAVATKCALSDVYAQYLTEQALDVNTPAQDDLRPLHET